MKNLKATHLRESVSEIYTSRGVSEAVNNCDKSWADSDQLCDPFVRVKIGESFDNNTEVLTTEAKEDTQMYNVGRLVMSDLIQKNLSYIEIEVLDKNENGNHDSLVWTSGTVDSFIKTPIRCSNSAQIRKKFIPGNCIEIDVVWQDKREKTEPETSERENVNHRRRNPMDQSEKTTNQRPAHRRKQDNDKDRKNPRKNRNRNNSARSGVPKTSTKNRSNTRNNTSGRNKSNRKNRA